MRGIVQPQPHVLLLLFVARQNSDLTDVRVAKTGNDGVAEGTRAAGD